MRDLLRGDDHALAMVTQLRDAAPDILVLTKIDFDSRGLALSAFADLLNEDDYPFRLPLRSNEGDAPIADLNGDGRIEAPDDAQGYGRFPGQGGLAILSRLPIRTHAVRTYNEVLWKDIPGSHILPGDAGHSVQKLSSGGHWLVPIAASGSSDPTAWLWLMIGHSGPPVFDGPEDRNGRRNLDELRLWSQILVGAHGPRPGPRVVFMANTNLDPHRGDGYRGAMADFLASGVFQDPLPNVPTAMWKNPGEMRVSYLLPSQDLTVLDAWLWPLLPDMTHRLITVDIAAPSVPEP